MAQNNIYAYSNIDLSLVTFNSAPWIIDFFLSLSAQQYPIDKIHVFVRDNGSTDETISLLEYVRSQQTGFASFQIEVGSNVGFGAGHNSNLKKGTSLYFLVSNLDLTFEVDAIPRIMTEALSGQHKVASWEFRQKPFEHPKYYNPITMETSWSSGACILFLRSAITSVGGYEPRIFMYGEDVELSYRMRAEGFILKYCPTAVCWHYSYGIANEVKPLQFIGSKLSNAYIRMRYGNWWQVLEIAPLFFALWLWPKRISEQRMRVLKATITLLHNAPYFLLTRKRRSATFPFNRFDYERCRQGAFYENQPLPSQTPLVSVIIRTYKDRKSYLKEAVSSVLNQTYPNVEIIVVEDGSVTSREFMLEIEARNALVSVRYLCVNKGGRSKAGNAALAIAAGKYLCFLDDDNLFFADHIEVLTQELLAHNTAGAAYGAAWQVVAQGRSATEWKYKNINFNLKHRQLFSRALLLRKNYIPIHAVLFNRTLFEECGGFNETLEHLEDWELLLRYAANHDFIYIPKLTLLCRQSESSKQAISKQNNFVSEYEKVMESISKMPITTTIGEIMKIAEIYSQEDYLFRIKRMSVKDIFAVLAMPTWLYNMLAKLRKIH